MDESSRSKSTVDSSELETEEAAKIIRKSRLLILNLPNAGAGFKFALVIIDFNERDSQTADFSIAALFELYTDILLP